MAEWMNKLGDTEPPELYAGFDVNDIKYRDIEDAVSGLYLDKDPRNPGNMPFGSGGEVNYGLRVMEEHAVWHQPVRGDARRVSDVRPKMAVLAPDPIRPAGPGKFMPETVDPLILGLEDLGDTLFETEEDQVHAPGRKLDFRVVQPSQTTKIPKNGLLGDGENIARRGGNVIGRHAGFLPTGHPCLSERGPNPVEGRYCRPSDLQDEIVFDGLEGILGEDDEILGGDEWGLFDGALGLLGDIAAIGEATKPKKSKAWLPWEKKAREKKWAKEAEAKQQQAQKKAAMQQASPSGGGQVRPKVNYPESAYTQPGTAAPAGAGITAQATSFYQQNKMAVVAGGLVLLLGVGVVAYTMMNKEG